MRRRFSAAAAVIVCAACCGAAQADTRLTGDFSSPNAVSVLAAMGETPAQFLAHSDGVTLSEFQQQVAAMQAGQPIPTFGTPRAPTGTTSAGTSLAGTRPAGATSVGTAAAPRTAASRRYRTRHHGRAAWYGPRTHAADSYSCQAFGSNTYTGNIYTGGATGWARLGFLQECNNPRGTISSACDITAKVLWQTKRGATNRAGVRCSTDAVVGQWPRGKKGSVTVSWGAYNKQGLPFTALHAGCVADGASAICSYKTTFRVGRNSYWGWVPG